MLNSPVRGNMEVIYHKLWLTGATGVYAARVSGSPMFYPVNEVFSSVISTGLIPVWHQHKRGMIPISFQNPRRLFVQPLIHSFAVPQSSRLIRPRGDLHLIIKA